MMMSSAACVEGAAAVERKALASDKLTIHVLYFVRPKQVASHSLLNRTQVLSTTREPEIHVQ
jgi:hypothetical protein